MKKANPILVTAILFAVMTGCRENNQPTDDIITVDVTKTYSPKKELILQDFMDVEYIPLETKDDFLNQGLVQAIGREIILVTNYNFDDGDIFIYDRKGKPLRKINHRGQSGEEYVRVFRTVLDEDNGEIFVYDMRKFIVYDLYGKFKRRLKRKEEGGFVLYVDIFNYDNDHLICYDKYNEKSPFVLVSKQDGSISKEIKIPFEKKIFLEQQRTDGETTNTVHSGPYRTIIPFKGNWMLSELSSDTVYTVLPDYSLQPFLVRTPPVQSMDPGVFLVLRFFSDRYYFMETIKNLYDWNTNRGFPRTFFMYDRQEKSFSGYTVYNGDYSTKKEIYMNRLRPVNHEIESWQPLEGHQLVESYRKGELKGKLKDIAATLDEDSNPVIMLVKHKK